MMERLRFIKHKIKFCIHFTHYIWRQKQSNKEYECVRNSKNNFKVILPVFLIFADVHFSGGTLEKNFPGKSLGIVIFFASFRILLHYYSYY